MPFINRDCQPGEVIIYGLYDPVTHILSYIGKTKNAVKHRLACHMNDSLNCRRTRWIRELKENGLKPYYRILEVVQESEGTDSECWWIKTSKLAGFNLTNETEGGNGFSPSRESLQKKQATRLKSQKCIQGIKRVAALNKGRKHTLETKLKMKTAWAMKRQLKQQIS